MIIKRNDLFFLFLFTLFEIYLISYWLIIFSLIIFILFLIYIIFKKQWLIFILLLIVLELILIQLYNVNSFNGTNYSGKIVEIYDHSIVVKVKHKKVYLNLNFETTILNNYYKGDIVKFNAQLTKVNYSNNSFDSFLNSVGVTYYGTPTEISFHNKSINGLRRFLHNEVSSLDQIYTNFASSILFGEFQNDEIKITINQLGISYLFVISGFHISIFYQVINNFKPNKYTKIISISLIFYLIYILYFPIPATRAFLTIGFTKILKLSNFNALGAAGLIFICIDYKYVFITSWTLSFISTYAIYLLNIKTSHKLLSSFITSLILFSITFPIVINWNGFYNLLAPFLAIILTPIIKWLYILVIIIYPFYFIWEYLNWFFLIIYQILQLFSYFYININIIEIIEYEIIIISIYNFLILTLVYNDIFNKNYYFLLSIPIISASFLAIV